MELEVKINASAKEVFNELMISIQEDVKNCTGKEIAVENLVQNYSYKKKLMNYAGSNVNIDVKIDELVYPTKYIATITSPKGANIVEYRLFESEDAVKILYKENYVTNSIFQKVNNMLMAILFTRSSKRKMVRNFNYLEQQILDKRAKKFS